MRRIIRYVWIWSDLFIAPKQVEQMNDYLFIDTYKDA